MALRRFQEQVFFCSIINLMYLIKLIILR